MWHFGSYLMSSLSDISLFSYFSQSFEHFAHLFCSSQSSFESNCFLAFSWQSQTDRLNSRLVPLLNGLFVSWNIWIWGFRCELNCRSLSHVQRKVQLPLSSGWPGLLRNFAETKCKCLSLHNYAWCSDHFHADMSNKSLVAVFIYRFNYRHSSQQGKRQKRGLLGEKALKKTQLRTSNMRI